ncbi:MAG: hypothetical protein ACXWKM_08240 [Phenylobacterium sp.]
MNDLRPQALSFDNWESCGVDCVKKASEYRRHAEECRQLASGVQGALRDQLAEMATTWERLAAERAELIQRHPELALDSESQAASAG